MPRLSEKTLDNIIFATLDSLDSDLSTWTEDALQKKQEHFEKSLSEIENRLKKDKKNPEKDPSYLIVRDWIEIEKRSLWAKRNVKRLRRYFDEKPDEISAEDWQKEKIKAAAEILEFAETTRPYSLDKSGYNEAINAVNYSYISTPDRKSRGFKMHAATGYDNIALLGDAVSQYPFPEIKADPGKHKEINRERADITKSMLIMDSIWMKIPVTELSSIDYKKYKDEWKDKGWEQKLKIDFDLAKQEIFTKPGFTKEAISRISKYSSVLERYGNETGFLEEYWSNLKIEDKVKFDPDRAVTEDEYRRLKFEKKQEIDKAVADKYFKVLSPLEKYRESRNDARDYFLANGLESEAGTLLKNEDPAFYEELWRNLDLEKRNKLDKARFDSEYKDLSFDKKLQFDKDRAMKYINSLSPEQMYKESGSTSIEIFRSWPLTLKEANTIQDFYPEFMDKYWDKLDLKERQQFDKSRFDKEYPSLPWDTKVKFDKALSEEYWNKLSPVEKYWENKDKAFDDFKNNPIPWAAVGDIKKSIEKKEASLKAAAQFESEYWNLLSDQQKVDNYLEQLNIHARYYEETNKNDSEVWQNILSVGNKVYADYRWNKAEATWKMAWDADRAVKEFVEKGITLKELEEQGFTAFDRERYLGRLTPDNKLQFAPEVFEKEWQEKTWEEKLSYHRDETLKRFNDAKTLADKIKIDKQHTFDDLKEKNTALSEITDENIRDEYFFSLSTAEKKELYEGHYNEIWNNGTYEEKKRLDSKRTNEEIFEPASYDEKLRLSRNDTLDWLSRQPEDKRNFEHPEDALELKEREIERKGREALQDKGELSKETVEAEKKAKEYVKKITTESGTIKLKKETDLFTLSANLILADKATIDDLYNIGRIAHRAAFSSEDRSKAVSSEGIRNFVHDSFASEKRVLDTTDIESIPRSLDDNTKKTFKYKLNEEGYVVLPKSVKEDLARMIRGLNTEELRLATKFDKGKDIVKDHNNGLIQGKKLFQENPSLRNIDLDKIAKDKSDAKIAIEKANHDALVNMKDGVDSLKEQFGSLRSHGPAFLDSKPYKDMKTAYNNFIKAYDNVIQGKRPNGEANDIQGRLSFEDRATLASLQEQMSQAADAYTAAKRQQKGGGIDKHSSDQGKDRLSFADALSEFRLTPGITEKINSISVEVKGKKKGEVKTVSLKDLEKGQDRGRKHLDSRIKKLTEKELSKKPAAKSMS